MKVIQSSNRYGYSIEMLEKKMNAKYIGDFSVKQKDGQWSSKAVSTFWIEHPDREKGYSNYFGIYTDHTIVGEEVIPTGTYITDAQSAFSEPIIGVRLEKHTVLISGYPHDYVEYGDIFIDGGRSTIRTNKPEWLVSLILDGPDFRILDVNAIEENLTLMEQEY